jgi:hypothetical protein
MTLKTMPFSDISLRRDDYLGYFPTKKETCRNMCGFTVINIK